MENNKYKNIHLYIDHNMVPAFFWFLEKGVRTEIEVGCDVRTMLSDQLNISKDYIDNRIKTIFLDGRPVGDINSTIINDGATLALSAAMPGLAGATFRRTEGAKPSQTIIKTEKEIIKSNGQKGVIIIKFFNLILKELGPVFLQSGMLVSKKELTDFFSRQSEKFSKACKSVKIDGRLGTIKELAQIDLSDDSDLFLLYVFSDH